MRRSCEPNARIVPAKCGGQVLWVLEALEDIKKVLSQLLGWCGLMTVSRWKSQFLLITRMLPTAIPSSVHAPMVPSAKVCVTKLGLSIPNNCVQSRLRSGVRPKHGNKIAQGQGVSEPKRKDHEKERDRHHLRLRRCFPLSVQTAARYVLCSSKFRILT